jgi:hypothetical protein
MYGKFLRTELLDDLSNLVGKLICLGASGSLSVDTACILSSTGASKGASAGVLLNTLVDLVLSTHRVAKATLSVSCLEEVLVANLDTDQSVRKVIVGHGPILESPSLVSKDNLDHEHVGDSITDSLVDKVADGSESIESILLGRRLGLSLTESTDSLLREDNGTVTVGLEVNTNIELASSVVQVLHTSRSEDNGKTQVLLDVVGAGTVGISGLNNADAKVVFKASRANKVANERSIERRDAVTVEHEEASIGVNPVVDQTVSVTVERAASGAGNGLRAGRSSLLGLDEVGTGLALMLAIAPEPR